MTKQIIFLLAAFCSVQAYAYTRPAANDTVSTAVVQEESVMLQTLSPSYLDGVVVPASRSGNWFVGLSGGASAFLGTPLGCEDLFGRVKPSYALTLGKWFSPSFGARLNYSGLQFKDAFLSTQDYHYVHMDLLWNILGRRYSRQNNVRWGLSPFAGVGLIHHATNGHNPFAFSYGLQGQYRISKRVNAIAEISGTTTFKDFDGYGRANRFGDHMLSLTVGLSFNLGRVGWKRAVDASPYISQNEWLVGYANTLSEANDSYLRRVEKDRKALGELKKIMKIEGLLDTYSHLFDDDTLDCDGYPRNNYSGLNSLRARLRNRQWDGKSLSENQPSNNAQATVAMGDTLNHCSDSVSAMGLVSASDSLCSGYRSKVLADGGCIGSPVYFFFELGTSHLTDSSQLINLDELARVATAYGLTVRVTGAADSATGTAAINDTLGVARADYIVAGLLDRGVPAESVIKFSKGGIADYMPDEANRHTMVELLLGNESSAFN